MNGYIPQSPERANQTTPPSISRRLSVTDTSVRFVLTATNTTYSKHIEELQRIEQAQRQVPMVPMSNSVQLEQAPVPSAAPTIEAAEAGSNVVRFRDPVSGDLMDSEQKKMIDDANSKLEDIYGIAA